MRQLGPEILAVLARRALRQVGTSLPPEWLTADRFNLDSQQFAHADRPEAEAAFLVALAGQLWRLLGNAASAPFRAALASAVPSLSQVFAVT